MIRAAIVVATVSITFFPFEASAIIVSGPSRFEGKSALYKKEVRALSKSFDAKSGPQFMSLISRGNTGYYDAILGGYTEHQDDAADVIDAIPGIRDKNIRKDAIQVVRSVRSKINHESAGPQANRNFDALSKLSSKTANLSPSVRTAVANAVAGVRAGQRH